MVRDVLGSLAEVESTPTGGSGAAQQQTRLTSCRASEACIVRGINELGREEELDGASDVLEQFCSELFGEKIFTGRGDGRRRRPVTTTAYCLNMARSMATNREDRGADVGDDGVEW
jgi:hypothetical protein